MSGKMRERRENGSKCKDYIVLILFDYYMRITEASIYREVKSDRQETLD